MIYLKTYFYTPLEIKWLKLNLLESMPHIDKFIICEYNVTHTGEKRDFIFEQYKHVFSEEELEKIQYLQCDISTETSYARDSDYLCHYKNEPIMRGHFVKKIHLDDDDIVFSVDADEIIYGNMYDRIIKEVKEKDKILLTLHQFFYKTNYHWYNHDFSAPTVAKYKCYKDQYPSSWRYDGENFNNYAGCHFSWCMSVQEMIYKLNTYSHPEYRFCASESILKDAVENKKYPFDTSVSFNIREIADNDPILPTHLPKIKDINV